MRRALLPLVYALFAGAATGVNILVQRAVLALYAGRFSLYLAMIAGTGAGLILKYFLDKRYIFRFRTRDLRDEARKFALYGLMSVVTTVIFWGVEISFHRLWNHPSAKYVGAAVGLAVGYTLKYFLDKRFVFVAPDQSASPENEIR